MVTFEEGFLRLKSGSSEIFYTKLFEVIDSFLGM
jgi:hypothetical protein